MPEPRPISVLFVHGLESGPGGRKAQLLAEAGFQVHAEQMPCGRAQVLRDPAVIAGGAGAALALLAAVRLTRLPGLALTSAALLAAAPFARARLFRRVLSRSVEVQRRALAAHRIDVVVGSSFGGAVAIALLRAGFWSGPTLLLCPAQALVAERAGRPPPSLAGLPEAVTSRILVVHGTGDTVVPVAHSRALIADSRAALVLVDDDHRLSSTATAPQFSRWLAPLLADEPLQPG